VRQCATSRKSCARAITHIARQRNPDGTAYASRKPRPEKNPRDKAGTHQACGDVHEASPGAFMNATSVAIGFVGRVARVARVHQFGESDRVAPKGPGYRYPERVLLGFTDADRAMIRDILLKHITA
jgi:phage virion morphogenesis protein